MVIWQSRKRKRQASSCWQQGVQGDLGGVGLEGEHRLAEERGAERHPVHTADESVAVPRLDGVREPQLVQLRVGLDHRGRDPRALVLPRHAGARGDHRRERPVVGRRVRGAPHRAAQAPVDADLAGHEHGARAGAEPRDRRPLRAGPREDPVGVRDEEAFGAQRAADGQQPVVAGPGDRRDPSARRAPRNARPIVGSVGTRRGLRLGVDVVGVARLAQPLDEGRAHRRGGRQRAARGPPSRPRPGTGRSPPA